MQNELELNVILLFLVRICNIKCHRSPFSETELFLDICKQTNGPKTSWATIITNETDSGAELVLESESLYDTGLAGKVIVRR
jgi:hypothetical protein